MKKIVNVIVATAIVFGFAVWFLLKPPTEMSVAEKRPLEQLPKISKETLLGLKGTPTFMDKFEKYAADQFPMRESFRALNSISSLYLLGKKENNNLYLSDGYIAKLEYEIHQESVDWSLNRIQLIKDQFLANSNVYLAIIPDKNYYLQKESGYPYFDFEKFTKLFRDGTAEYAQYIDLSKVLTLDNYYLTDTHWRQESLQETAAHIIKSMGGTYDYSFNIKESGKLFKGVYYGQLGIPVRCDPIRYTTGSYIDGLKVSCLDTGKPVDIGVYNQEKLDGKDMYEYFLSGSKALITIENPAAKSEKNLIIFRDSFSSSMAPLLAGEYKTVTLIDIRYIHPMIAGRFVSFDGADVLFLYSAQVLNNSVGQFIN